MGGQGPRGAVWVSASPADTVPVATCKWQTVHPRGCAVLIGTLLMKEAQILPGPCCVRSGRGKVIFQTGGEETSFRKAEYMWLAGDAQTSFPFGA